jgi:diketogulonate reductase-like aldo/keto reductase
VIDSSPMYGSSQDTVGHGLAKLGCPSVFAADKVWTPTGGDGREQIAHSRRK